MQKLLKKICILLFVAGFFSVLSAETTIKPMWQSVVGGNITAPPKRTSYGFICLAEGKIMSACTESGSVIWRKSIKGEPSEFYTVNNQNFVYLTTDKASKLSFYNPDGNFLWEAILPEPAIADPVAGKDGRVFIMGKSSITCYGIRGTKKWTVSLSESAGFPLMHMNDGSLLYIPSLTEDNASIGIRVSPYGEIIEKIQFTALISSIAEFSDGVIIGFSNGTIGSCTVINNASDTMWSFSSAAPAVAQKIIVGNTGFCVLLSNSYVAEYSLKNQNLVWQYLDSSLVFTDDLFSSYDDDSYIFASGAYTVAYKSGNADEENVLWQKNIPSLATSLYTGVTHSGYLIVAHSDWILSAYYLKDSPPVSASNFPVNYKIESYTGFLPSESMSVSRNLLTIQSILKTGDYDIQEPAYKKIVEEYVKKYERDYMNTKPSLLNTEEKSHVFTTLAFFETTDYNYLIPIILKNESEPFALRAALTLACNIAYDPTEIMMQAIEEFFYKNKTALHPVILYELCEAVYSICEYMGKPSLVRRGKDILMTMLLLEFDNSVKQKAQNVMLRFIESETN
ncbi:MAG: hypothetical protein R3Y36_07410 [Spirochaetales bacterium]